MQTYSRPITEHERDFYKTLEKHYSNLLLNTKNKSLIQKNINNYRKILQTQTINTMEPD